MPHRPLIFNSTLIPTLLLTITILTLPTPAQSTRPISSDFGPPPTPPQTPQPSSELLTQKPRTGSFQLTFSAPSDKSPLDFLSRRLGWSIPAMQATGKTLTYDLSKSTFQLYVPPNYDPSTPYGLLVWISPGEGGAVPKPGYLDVFNRRKIIYIGPDWAGNINYWPVRVGKALDAAANVETLYKIDPKRVYAAGLSGGGRAASMLAIGFPDVFTGGIYVAGCDFYRDVPLEEPHRFWQRNFFPPPKPLLQLTRTTSRHVLMTGPGDINRDQINCNYKAFQNDGFRHVTLFDVPTSHSAPTPEDLDRALAFLDSPPTSTPTPKPSANSTPQIPNNNPSTKPTTSPATDPAKEAESDLKAARLYIQASLYPQARQRLTHIIQSHPNSPSATEAQQLLNSLPD